ncbi:U1 small nuclear ribonucleoprotein, putative [Babesia caballi]|uniref:U1 small nuclear ribonucleoprotein C n=1 Tax=Babesia caballi TaxID=5871 RepID=A0AAV4LPJ7_BABCB|nr:U1 small nuclear ribonucleoprotein, putative [Babesia caballi]
MPKFYCEYCGIYLTHSSPAGRKQHSMGRKHINMKVDYYQNLVREHFFQPPPYTLAGATPGGFPPIVPTGAPPTAANHMVGQMPPTMPPSMPPSMAPSMPQSMPGAPTAMPGHMGHGMEPLPGMGMVPPVPHAPGPPSHLQPPYGAPVGGVGMPPVPPYGAR